jgi:YfiH family protein
MRALVDPVLAGVDHGFGVRGFSGPAGLLRPRQVHGAAVVTAAECRVSGDPPQADAIVSDEAGQPIGVVTADCVPILLATADGRVVAAIHAGWRGLVAGVVASGVEALRSRAGVAGAGLRAAIGPSIGRCCYEVDAPVLGPLAERFGPRLAALQDPVSGRPGHARIDLAGLVREDLLDRGLTGERVGQATAACTRCDAERFHSFRRDGDRAGRLVHFIVARPAPSLQG